MITNILVFGQIVSCCNPTAYGAISQAANLAGAISQAANLAAKIVQGDTPSSCAVIAQSDSPILYGLISATVILISLLLTKLAIKAKAAKNKQSKKQPRKKGNTNASPQSSQKRYSNAGINFNQERQSTAGLNFGINRQGLGLSCQNTLFSMQTGFGQERLVPLQEGFEHRLRDSSQAFLTRGFVNRVTSTDFAKNRQKSVQKPSRHQLNLIAMLAVERLIDKQLADIRKETQEQARRRSQAQALISKLAALQSSNNQYPASGQALESLPRDGFSHQAAGYNNLKVENQGGQSAQANLPQKPKGAEPITQKAIEQKPKAIEDISAQGSTTLPSQEASPPAKRGRGRPRKNP